MTAAPFPPDVPVGSLRPYLDAVGTVFAVFDRQDSGNHGYGVEVAGQRWFVKTAGPCATPAALPGLDRVPAFHAAVQHRAVVPLRARFSAAGVPVLAYPWADGELLNHATVDGGLPRREPNSVWSRFRRLPVAEIEAAVADLLAAHLVVDAAGFVAGDLYDGCFLYDFAERRLRLIDFDEYRPGPFVAADQPCGSPRFMAPEEVPGGTIDARTTVFTLGRALRLLLDAGDDEADWRGSAAQLDVVVRATRPDPADRYADVAALTAAWRI